MLTKREIEIMKGSVRPTVNKNEEILIHSDKVTWSGSGASLAITITGAELGDKVQATIESAPTEAAYIKSAKVTANTLTITLSAANTSDDAVISYNLYR